MKQIKRGRERSKMDGFAGIIAVCFGIFWTILAGSMAPFMAIFGILWTALAVMNVVYSFKNADSDVRYSEYDIVEDYEDDPEKLKKDNLDNLYYNTAKESNYCPYCGEEVQKDYLYCNKCGNKLP